ncbi:hypothetical protein [Streptomyces griseosporeus]|uniref:hypothetical protein n=1 Tax=Streptomyces griseosporeus TaxID=1910 RepID=UPI0036F97D2A
MEVPVNSGLAVTCCVVALTSQSGDADAWLPQLPNGSLILCITTLVVDMTTHMRYIAQT